MFSPLTVITTLCLYMAVLFGVAAWAERQSVPITSGHPILYSLTLAVYCTSWTFYGSIGKAVTSGMLFLTIYLGPTLSFFLAWIVLRKLVRIKTSRRITSIADFISARYNGSQAIAAMVTIIALVGILPYIALQLKAVISTFQIITVSEPSTRSGYGEPLILLLIILFTNLFGIRRLEPTERHPGMMVAIAVKSVVKLLVFWIVGGFITGYVFNGFGDIFRQLSDIQHQAIQLRWKTEAGSYATWAAYLILSMSAVFFLPHQFHVAVVENYNETDIKTAMWLFPMYLILMNLFVFPVAVGGLLKGFRAENADIFLLILPTISGHEYLALTVFIGGFAAATGMILISSMTLSTMVTNHLVLPAAIRFHRSDFIRRRLLACRWAVAAMLILLGYAVEKKLGESYMLVNMGMLSFAAVIQFAPAILGGIFWKTGNRIGAMAGLTAGFVSWLYTLLLPAFVKSGWLSADILTQGPLGFCLLRPEHLFGMTGLDNLTHSVFWSLLFNIAFYVLGSLAFEASAHEQTLAAEFVDVLTPVKPRIRKTQKQVWIDLPGKQAAFERLLKAFFPENRATELLIQSLQKLKLLGKVQISIGELAELYGEIEKSLAGAVGSAAARSAMTEANLITPEESEELSIVYSEILEDLKISPEELKNRVRLYQEKEALLNRYASELEIKYKELANEIVQRERVEIRLRESETELRRYTENLAEMVNEKTKELQSINEELSVTVKTLKETREQLAVKAHQAGMAEIAVSVLHNIGNAMNSINVRLYDHEKRISDSDIQSLEKISGLLQSDDIRFSQPEKKEKLIRYFSGIIESLKDGVGLIGSDCAFIRKGIDHILEIIALQQRYAGVRGFESPENLNDLLNDAVEMLMDSIQKRQITLEWNLKPIPKVLVDKNKMIQIFINIIKNAYEAIDALKEVKTIEQSKEIIRISSSLEPEDSPSWVQIVISDTGIGIAPEAIDKVFRFHYSTKVRGSGFGLHDAANYIAVQQGTIQIDSDGVGTGARVRIRFPAFLG